MNAIRVSNKIIGIDPGVQTGVAIYEGGHLEHLATIEVHGYYTLLQSERPGLVIVEDSRLQSHVFTAPKITGNAKNKVARNIGMVDGFCHLLESLCKALEIEIISVSPLGKGSKYNAKVFGQITGYQGRTNQHERDAAMVARPFRNQITA